MSAHLEVEWPWIWIVVATYLEELVSVHKPLGQRAA